MATTGPELLAQLKTSVSPALWLSSRRSDEAVNVQTAAEDKALGVDGDGLPVRLAAIV